MTTKFKTYADDLCCGNDCGHSEPSSNSLIENNIFRVGSEKYFEYFRMIREDYKSGNITIHSELDIDLLESNIGEFTTYEGKNVPLDCPMTEEADDDKSIGKPQRGGPKKFYVYVKDGDKVKKVTFGDTTGLKAKINNPEARASFAARHNCADKKDRTTPGYWSCRLPRYAAQLGLSGGGNFFW